MAEVHITNNFYAPIGQQIDHIDHQEVHFDKDMQLHVAQDLTKGTEETTNDAGMLAGELENGACGDENKLKQIIHSTTRPDGAKAQEGHGRRFPYFSREATDKDKQEFEACLRDAAPRGNRYVVEAINTFAYYIDLRGVRNTDLHKELQQWGLGSKYCSFNSAMANCKCIR